MAITEIRPEAPQVTEEVVQDPRVVLINNIRADLARRNIRLSEHGHLPDEDITPQAIEDRALLLTLLHEVQTEPSDIIPQREHLGRLYRFKEKVAKVHNNLLATHTIFDAVNRDQIMPGTFLLDSESILFGFLPGRGQMSVKLTSYRNEFERVDMITVDDETKQQAFIGRIPGAPLYKKKFVETFGLKQQRVRQL